MGFDSARVERLFKVLGDESRLRIIRALASGERSVSEILDRADLPQTLASFHLRILREAGVLRAERRGPYVYYALADPSLANLLDACTSYARGLTDTGAAPDFQWPPFWMMCRMMRAQRR
jgi:DNA-binding transcriptional ArsR family regulator